MLKKQLLKIGKTFQNINSTFCSSNFLTFDYSFIQMFHKYLTGCVQDDIHLMCEKDICNKQM